MKRLIVALLALTLVAAACGDSDDVGASGGGGDDSSPLVAPIAAAMLEDPDTPFTEAEANCVAEDVVNDIGETRLIELGITAELAGSVDEIDFTPEEIRGIGGSVADCAPDFLARAFASTGEFTDDQASCLADAFDRDAIVTMFEAGVADADPPEEFLQTMFGAITDCEIPLG